TSSAPARPTSRAEGHRPARALLATLTAAAVALPGPVATARAAIGEPPARARARARASPTETARVAHFERPGAVCGRAPRGADVAGYVSPPAAAAAAPRWRRPPIRPELRWPSRPASL